MAGIAREIGFTQASVSAEVSPLIKLVGRGDTTVLDAYLSPILRRYVSRVAGDVGRRIGSINARLPKVEKYGRRSAVLNASEYHYYSAILNLGGLLSDSDPRR